MSQGVEKDSLTASRILRLREHTGCSVEKAKEALLQGEGSLLSAVLYLEEQGHIGTPKAQGFFSTKEYKETNPPINGTEKKKGKTLLQGCREELIDNYLELWYKDHFLGHIPVVCVMMLMPITYGSVFPLLIAPLFFGVYYRFSSVDSFLGEFNPILKRMTRMLYRLKRGFVAEIKKYYSTPVEKRSGKP